jgi:hypothetical protein
MEETPPSRRRRSRRRGGSPAVGVTKEKRRSPTARRPRRIAPVAAVLADRRSPTASSPYRSSPTLPSWIQMPSLSSPSSSLGERPSSPLLFLHYLGLGFWADFNWSFSDVVHRLLLYWKFHEINEQIGSERYRIDHDLISIFSFSVMAFTVSNHLRNI